MSAELTPGGRFRTLHGPLRITERVLLSLIPVVGILYVMDVQLYMGKPFLREQYVGFVLALVLGAVFLTVPAGRKSPRTYVPWYDSGAALLGLSTGLYLTFFYPGLINTLGDITPERVVLGTLALLAVFEATRRLLGWFLLVIAGIFAFYARFSYLFPGMLYGRGLPWDQLINHLYIDSNALIGIPLFVIGTIVLAFVVFGQVLFATGGGQVLTDLAFAAFGRFRGGPAKMAVIASSLFGTMSGSAVANVVTTGVITIPMMKQTGYSPQMAGAIEAVASTGGLLMPPIMGASAFIMAEFLAIPYARVAIAAFIPAVLYYVALFVQVDLEAGKRGLRGLPREHLPSVRDVARRGWPFVIPPLLIIYVLFVMNLDPAKSGIYGAAAALIINLARRKGRLGLRKLAELLEATGRVMLEIGVVGAVAGVVIGLVTVTGLGFIFSLLVVKFAAGSALLLLAVGALAAMFLGMGLPAVAVYILLAILLAPALVELGLEPLAAHLFVIYFGNLAMITPPICVAAYAAATLAGSDPIKTGFEAMRLGTIAYVVPFVFAFSPVLLLQGAPAEIVLAVVTAVAGATLLGIALEGYLFRKLHWLKRVLIGMAAVALLVPSAGGPAFLWPSDIAGALVALPLLVAEWRHGRRGPAHALGAPRR